MTDSPSQLKVLSIDIGGSHIKATVLNSRGELQVDYAKVETPQPASPANLVKAIKKLVQGFPSYNKIAAGFPGYVKNGMILTAPNLGTELWKNVDLRKQLEDELGCAAHIVNDADMQGLGVVSGQGFEMVITLGTGFGTALLMDGYLLPHLELAHHPFTKNKTYDEYVGEKALETEGGKKWNNRMKKVLEVLKTVFNYDHLYIGGGNASKLTFALDENITIVSNKDGIKGGSRLWQMELKPHNIITS